MAGYILAAGALAAAVMAPICLTVAFTERRRFLVRLASLFLGLWCLAYGVTASLGFVSTAREASNAERAAAIEVRQQAKARHDAAAAELASLSAAKSTQWRAARAKELQGVMTDAAKATKIEKTVTVTDPQAQALTLYLAAIGFVVTPESVSVWTTAFTTAFFEVAGAFALLVARSPSAAGNFQATSDLPTSCRPPATKKSALASTMISMTTIRPRREASAAVQLPCCPRKR